ncbi:MAG: 50S ribosomal protein L3 [Candidatus Kerfeldbacteria bacterium]|nr:50S ribosomal protein L3 [Candidatus Kerfeldbacteria bacterium]
MTKFIMATKIGMSRTFRPDGAVVPVTKLKAGPCLVTGLRTSDRHGYQAVQLGYGEVKRLPKPQAGSLKAMGKLFRHLHEFRLSPGQAVTIGQTIDVSQFAPGEFVSVVGWSKGRGFQGVVKRHGFHGHPSTHGHKDQLRMPGSIGAGGVQHVRKGMRMAGRMGQARVTVHKLEVVAVDQESNELLLRGAVPGTRRGLVLVTAA